jgi:ribosomal protein S8
MNLVLALGFLAGGGMLVYSGFKNLSFKDTIAAINGKRTGKLTDVGVAVAAKEVDAIAPSHKVSKPNASSYTKQELAALASGSLTGHKKVVKAKKAKPKHK